MCCGTECVVNNNGNKETNARSNEMSKPVKIKSKVD